ncbi:LytTR family DNA-binding domain-containing protein [Stenotrophomonas sp. SY1]|uniref:LytR/AlgR family response regulator transcription factor n=1 Tax=Stenotrophomonas sp. SY1 TaxID=477235 RepID=UPI001E6115E2|nr:LytTR family DNA-binding domain-containing protein [Stenotrophomonas sp. SY1]MCD9086858.1 LytTR family DNA-binding domain-containing protein [Stenotrophomonas sp. SY1]
MIRVLLVDDVPLARDKLRHLLAAHADIDIRGEAGDVEQARQLLQHEPVDLLLLDIQMPGNDGLQLASQLPAPAPLVIFTTAHAQHAVESYGLGAVDYLLKPLDGTRLALALERARRQLAHAGSPALQSLCIRNGARTDYVAVADIDYIDNAGHYACIHVGRQVHLLRESMGRLAEQLAPAGFIQVQRAVIVNLARVRTLEPRRNGDATLLLTDDNRLPLSRLYRDAFDAAMRARS